MIVYNLTIKIDPAIEQEWLQWQQTEHIPEVMATGSFTECKLFRLLEQDESDGLTYVMQYFAASMENYQSYLRFYASELRNKTLQKWGDRFIAFRTVMEVVN